MEPFSDYGQFWLPTVPTRQTAGLLTFDGDNLALELDGALEEFVYPEDQTVDMSDFNRVEHETVLGRLRERGDVTLLDVSGSNLRGPFTHVKEVWRARLVLVGALSDTGLVDQVSVHLDGLLAWSNPSPLSQWDATRRSTSVNLSQDVLAQAAIDGGAIELCSSWSGETGGESVNIQRECFFRVSAPSGDLDSYIERWVRPLQDLLIVLLGRSVRLTHLYARPAEPGYTTRMPEVVFRAIQPELSTPPSTANIQGYGSPILYTLAELPLSFDVLVANWLSLRRELSETITLLCSPFYAPFIYSEHRYGSTFQSAEGIARARFSGKEKERAAHRARVHGIVDAATQAGRPSEDVAWAQRVLTARNDKSLPELIKELINSTGRIGEAVTTKSPDFAKRAAAARTSVYHPRGGGAAAPSDMQRFWHGQVLQWVVRARLLQEMGVDRDLIADKALSYGHLTWALEQLD